MRRLLLSVATAAAALTTTACGDSIGPGGVAGSYELVAVNGDPLPASDVSGSVTFYGGVLDLDSRGRFNDLLQFRGPGDPAIINDELEGDWDISGDEIELLYDEGFRYFGRRLSSNRIEVDDNSGNTFEYRRF